MSDDLRAAEWLSPLTADEETKLRESARMLGDDGLLHWTNNAMTRVLATLDRDRAALDVGRLARVVEDIDFGEFWDETPVIEGGVRVATEAALNRARLSAAMAREYRALTQPDTRSEP